MRRALRLAIRGQGSVEPNPMVGCVIARGDRVLGEGWHRRFGGPHAEVEALRACKSSPRAATAYVTLEPCCHFGKTPPCTDALIEAGITRVVAAMGDPFPKVRGGGVRKLRAAGIEVETGLLEPEARRLNAPYLKLQRTGRPWIILKWAQSLDGKLATRSGDSKWISGEASRGLAHRLRGRIDAVIVGVGTVLADDPLLTCRVGRPRRIAARIVLDPDLRTPPGARVLRTAGAVPTIIVTGAQRGRTRKANTLARRGAEILPLPGSKANFDLGRLLDELGRRGMTNVMVEGGGRTLGAFHDAALADEAIVFVSPRLIGGDNAPSALGGTGPDHMHDLRSPASIRVSRLGTDFVYHLRWDPA